MVEVKNQRIAGWHENDDVIAAHMPDAKRSTVQEHVYHKETGVCQNLKTQAPKVITKQPRVRPECIVAEGDSCPTITASNCSKNANNQPWVMQPLKFLNRNQKTPTKECMQAIDTARSNGLSNGSTIRRLTPLECERLQGYDDNYTKYGRTKDGQIIEISDTQRYKMMGNAVSEIIPQIIAERLFIKAYKESR